MLKWFIVKVEMCCSVSFTSCNKIVMASSATLKFNFRSLCVEYVVLTIAESKGKNTTGGTG